MISRTSKLSVYNKYLKFPNAIYHTHILHAVQCINVLKFLAVLFDDICITVFVKTPREFKVVMKKNI